MASDRDLVSTEEHELNYLLQKWNKKQSKDNREELIKIIKAFKKDPDFKPHNRENFYLYIEKKSILPKLDSSNSEKSNSSISYNDLLNYIRLRAYELYEKRIKNLSKGDDISDWLKAEKEIKKKFKMK